ncbi:MAG: tetratricopeptide repeat protein [bacterium]|nr:tetratricopeptide repeat protein [bacterium]
MKSQRALERYVESALGRRGWLPAVLLAALIYLPTLHYGFTYDDNKIIVRNPRIRHLDMPSLYLATSWWSQTGLTSEYRPLTMASFALNYAAGRLEPAGYHAVNIILHALNCALLWLLAARLFRDARLAAVAALLFAIHPIHVEVVAGVVGRAELLATAGFLLGLLAAHAAPAADGARRRWAWSLAVLPAAALSIFSKEHGVMLPAAIALLALAPPPDGAPGKAAPPARRLAALAPAMGAAAAVVILYFVARRAVTGAFLRSSPVSPLDNPLVLQHWPDRWLTALGVAARYGLGLVAPFNPSPDYSYQAITPVTDASDPIWIPGAALFAAVLAVALFARRRPALRFAAGLLLVTFAVASNLLVTIGTIMGERLLYLPSAGFCLGTAALALGECLATPGGRAIPPAPARRRWGAWALAAWGLLLLGQHARYLPVWRNDTSLFTYTVARVPRSARAHFNRAYLLDREGQPAKALAELREGYQIYPDDDAFVQMGVELARLGRDAEARDIFERALAVNEKHPQLNRAMADLLTRGGEPARAEAILRRAVALDPESPAARFNLGAWLAGRGRWAESLPQLEPLLAVPGAAELPDLADLRRLVEEGRRHAAAPPPDPNR